MMRVHNRYVEDTLRIQQHVPELLDQLHAGSVTLKKALRTLDDETVDRGAAVAGSRLPSNRMSIPVTSHLGAQGLGDFTAF